MTSKTMAFFFLILVVGLSSCGTQPVIPEASETPTPYQEPVVSPTATLTALPLVKFTTAIPTYTPAYTTPSVTPTVTLRPVPTATPLMSAEGVSPILYAPEAGDWLMLLGGVQRDGKWIQWQSLIPYLENGALVDFYHANSPLSVAALDWSFNPPCQLYTVNSSASLPGHGVAVIQNWKVSAPATVDLATDDPIYAQAVTDWLQQQGFSPAKLIVTRILQVDLEGDGVKEVLINATYYASTVMPVTQAGDYSVVLLRKVSGNDVVTVPIAAEYYPTNATEATYANTYSLEQVLDLNRDGKMEIIVGIRHWEGLGAIIFEIRDAKPLEALKADC
jgi:hypothetical protein